MTVIGIQPDRVDRLDALNDDQFERLIRANLDTLTPGGKDLWRALSHPDLADRTAGCLDEIGEKLAAEIAERNLPGTHHLAKQLNRVQARLRQVEATQTRAGRREANNAAEGDRHRELLRLLTLAVNRHRLACVAADLSPEPHDEALWAALDELRLAGGEPRVVDGGPSLAEMVTTGPWH